MDYHMLGWLDCKVLISGMQGLGAEIAKNLILAGVQSLTLHDRTAVELWDLCGSSMFSENDLGKNKALACVPKLQKLNSWVEISVLTKPNEDDVTKDDELTEDDLSHFQVVIFTDISLEKAIEFDYYCHHHQPSIAFIRAEVRGLFARVFSDFAGEFNVDGRTATQPLQQALKNPGVFFLIDCSKADLLHLAFQALDKFIVDMGRCPVAGSEEDAEKFISLITDIDNGQIDSIDTTEQTNRELLKIFAYGARAVLNPIAVMIGGIVGQEVMKYLSKNFQPISQFLYFDAVQCLPFRTLDPTDLQPLGGRYDAQISVFGLKLQKKMEEANIFFVGSGGALCCELVKNFATMGVCCGKGRKFSVVDDFSDWDICLAASVVDALLINPGFHIEILQNHDTESDSFWEELSVAINSVDVSVYQRRYIDWKSCYFRKPLFKVATSGMRCSTQIVLPHITDHHGALEISTVCIYPQSIQDCLRWAISEFQNLFVKTPAEVNAYLDDPIQYTAAMKNAGGVQAQCILEWILQWIGDGSDITWARMRFEHYFANQIKLLVNKFPDSAVTSPPKPLQFSSDDKTHIQFINAATSLRGEILGMTCPYWENLEMLALMADNVVLDIQPMGDVFVDNVVVIEQLVENIEGCREKLPEEILPVKLIYFNEDDDTHMDMILSLANLRARSYGIPEIDKFSAKFIARRIAGEIAISAAIPTGLVCLELYKVLDGYHRREDYRDADVDLALGRFVMDAPYPPKVIQREDTSWSLWDKWIYPGNPTVQELLEWLGDRRLNGFSISFKSWLLWSHTMPTHQESMGKKLVDLVKDVAKVELSRERDHFDVAVVCKTNEGRDIDTPLISIFF